MPANKKDVEDILKKYGKELDQDVKSYQPVQAQGGDSSKEFAQFKEDMMPDLSRYEKWCNSLGNILKLKLASKDETRIQGTLNSAHLDVTPGQVVGLSLMSSFLVFLVGLLISVALFFFTGEFGSGLVLFLFLAFIAAAFLFYYFYSMPDRLANSWRLKAGSQMIPCILYTVVYMKHTSNLELAVRFASEHLEAPLNMDLRKVFWDVEVGKFSTIKESLDAYLESWRKDCPEFVESFNLIESSLYEPTEARRVLILEKALQVILDGVYDKMLKYTHSVKAPLTNIYMLGIVLPTLGLALLPLASAMLGGVLKWYHVFVLFNLIVPFLVFYMTSEIMMKRPGGYGEASALEANPLYAQYKSKKPYIKAGLICFPLLLLGLMPFIFQYTPIPEWIGLQKDYALGELGMGGGLESLKMFDFIGLDGGGVVGPMGPVALLLSLFIPLALFLFFSISFKMRTKELIKAREDSRKLEGEFNNSLFQLGNRLGDGLPAEIAFGRVAESSRGQITENFFKIVNSNIRSLGMSLEKAIFDLRRGAIIYYPSNLIATSMHILIESVKKGLQVAAQSLMSISDYVRNINKINDRLRDLLADVVSDMKSNMTFLAPLLAGIVIGLASMITLILSKLTAIVNMGIGGSGEVPGGMETITNITKLFQIEGMMPPYFLQVVIGIYIIEIVFILTKALITVDVGQDKLKETNEVGKNLMRGGILYLIVALISILALSLLAGVALSGLI